MTNIVFLGPAGATFSYEAYEWFSRHFRIPKLSDSESRQIPVRYNEDVIPTLLRTGGYGVIAMETKTGGRVVEPVESFIRLFDATAHCRMNVIAAYKMPIHFAFMLQQGTDRKSIKTVLAHQAALTACKGFVNRLDIAAKKTSSNGLAAKRAAESKYVAALGPKAAAEKYSLAILDEHCEDTRAVTTFFLLSTKGEKPERFFRNRALIVFRLKDEPGALVQALDIFGCARLNMIHIHSAYATGGYDFAVELDIAEKQLSDFERVTKDFERRTQRCLVFGPFGVVEE